MTETTMEVIGQQWINGPDPDLGSLEPRIVEVDRSDADEVHLHVAEGFDLYLSRGGAQALAHALLAASLKSWSVG